MAITIREIAKKAGVCEATVSRVLNNSSLVRPETRQRVEAVIQEMNYTPSMAARALSNRKTSTIAVIIPDITNPFFSDAICGISQIINPSEYSLIFFDTNENPLQEIKALNTALSYMVSGIIYCPQSETNDVGEQIQELKKRNMPVVFLDREIEGLDCSGVFTDGYRGAYEAVAALIEGGNRRVAIVHGPVSTHPGRSRLQGYRDAMRDAGLEVLPQYVKAGDFKQETARGLMLELLKEPVMPDAVFSCNNLMSIGCMEAIEERGLRVPEDIAFAGFDELDRYDLLGQGLTVVTRDSTEMGREAARFLLKRIGDPQQEAKRVMQRTKLHIRGSETRKGVFHG